MLASSRPNSALPIRADDPHFVQTIRGPNQGTDMSSG
jgi:hypothetical protein